MQDSKLINILIKSISTTRFLALIRVVETLNLNGLLPVIVWNEE